MKLVSSFDRSNFEESKWYTLRVIVWLTSSSAKLSSIRISFVKKDKHPKSKPKNYI